MDGGEVGPRHVAHFAVELAVGIEVGAAPVLNGAHPFALGVRVRVRARVRARVRVRLMPVGTRGGPTSRAHTSDTSSAGCR